MNPPGFVWRPQGRARTYELEVARDDGFKDVAYRSEQIGYNCHCPPETLDGGRWFWRVRFRDKDGSLSRWSKTRSFTLGDDAVPFPMPAREELLDRIPKEHPRLFVRPEQLGQLRELARGELKAEYEKLVAHCEKLLKNPPPTAEPPKYPEDCAYKSEQWRKIWWGNRRYTIRALNGAATLAFTRLLGGKDDYGQLARRILLDCAEWDPKGATGYRYNDEAGMPYNYYFARTYTFVHDLLSEEERKTCQQVMRVRGWEMYRHLCPRHLWRPYSSHSNRAWHFLGEVGIAFHGEIPEASHWVWFAHNVFFNVYPVWSDDDGGWHEGVSYWSSYIHRFTWWADVMRAATRIDAYRKPYFSKVGYYPIYLMPPGTVGGGFGDLTARRRSRHCVPLMTNLAAQAQNPHWQWYVEAHGGPRTEGGTIGFVRGALPEVEARPPTDLPASRCFRGTGQACLNTTLLNAKDNVHLVFKSSPFGTQSHGYEANNAFLLYAYGQRLLIRTGRRDLYGSRHHKNWMWHTRSVNSVTVNGHSQRKRNPYALGEILAFHTSPQMDYVAGEAGEAYAGKLDRFTRHLLFVKPGLVVIFDRLEAPKPATFEWWLHAPTEMQVDGQDDIRVVNKQAGCRAAFLAPEGLELSQTSKFDPPPRPRVKLVEWHLTARTPKPAREAAFITVLRPHRVGQEPPSGARLRRLDKGYELVADLTDGRLVVLLRAADTGTLTSKHLSADADLAALRTDQAGKPVHRLTVRGRTVQAGP
ncbi:MAG: DUF4962 domain-containing protein [Planctomycetota bacterium]